MRHLLPVYAIALNCLASIVLADISQPDGYRMELYDDKVPDSLDGASTVTAVEVKRLQDSIAAVVVDVIPQHSRPKALPENQVWSPVPHRGIPEAVWLPDTGYGVLSEITEKYFKQNLNVVTNGDRNHPVIFYCRANCWMSWNAAKRALSYGYTDVYWFSDGIDDWIFEGFETEILTPAKGQRQAETSTN